MGSRVREVFHKSQFILFGLQLEKCPGVGDICIKLHNLSHTSERARLHTLSKPQLREAYICISRSIGGTHVPCRCPQPAMMAMVAIYPPAAFHIRLQNIYHGGSI